MIQKFLSGVIAEEWAENYAEEHPEGPLLTEKNELAKELSDKSLLWLQEKPPLGYHEMSPALTRIQMDCSAILQSFHLECKLPMSSIPGIPQDCDITGTVPGAFTIDVARMAIGTYYNRLRDSLGRAKKKELAAISERRDKVEVNITRYTEIKVQNDNRVSAAFASAFVSLRTVPDKVSPVVKGIMNGVKVYVKPSHLRPIADAYTERGERRSATEICGCSGEVHRLLFQAWHPSASRQDRQEFVHLPLSRC
jgi:TATA-binding protein-associated factor